HIYLFEPFLSEVDVDLVQSTSSGREKVDITEVDTVVVPAREDGFRETFLGQDQWYAIRMNSILAPQIAYIAVYRVAPISAITHIAPVRSIEPWKDTGKYVVNLAAPADELQKPIVLVKKGRVKALQNLRYTTKERLDSAKTLDDVW
ncbi:MAG TPA: hypothetical protein VJZ27_07690, partial [Aggregatilineales bacterium]|nr:hypothetical protein [Aggregatilineales bacterium]